MRNKIREGGSKDNKESNMRKKTSSQIDTPKRKK
jgi:hypothetical protein